MNKKEKQEQEYTEVYTFKEKLPLIGKVLVGGILFATVYHYYLFPIQKEYFDNMHCRNDYIFEAKIVVHGFFFFFLLIPLYLTYLGSKVIKYKKFPIANKCDFKRKI